MGGYGLRVNNADQEKRTGPLLLLSAGAVTRPSLLVVTPCHEDSAMSLAH